MVVWLIHQLGLDHEVRCGFVVRHRYVVHLSDTEQSLHIRIVWCCRERIREEYHEIYPTLHYLGTDLLVSSKRTAVVALHLKVCPVCYHAGCSSRSTQLMLAQYVPVVLRHLEDNGYQCMDNIPPLLLAPAFTLCEKVEVDTPVALGVDSRSGALFNAEAVINAIDQSGDSHDISILFLEADTETLIDRYKETRRDHPLMKNGTSLERAIAKEREMLQPLRERANYVLSTGGLRPKELCARVDELLADGENQATLRTEIMSFGYKRGIPRESDLVFDVRFLPNPFYIKEIRAYTGLEAPVRDYVMGKEETREFLSHLYELVDYLLPLYQREGKRRLMIAIGCTGGAHRSVAISEALGAHLRALGQPVSVSHRDITLEEASWPFRREK